MTLKEAAKLVERQMPGWRIAPQEQAVSEDTDPQDHGFFMKRDSGPSLERLRKKFLGSSSDADASENGAPLVQDGSAVTTVQIEPVDGGPAKTADIRDGKITIVQG